MTTLEHRHGMDQAFPSKRQVSSSILSFRISGAEFTTDSQVIRFRLFMVGDPTTGPFDDVAECQLPVTFRAATRSP